MNTRGRLASSRPAVSRTRLLVRASVALAILLGIAAGAYWYLTRGIQVVDLTNWKISDAKLWAENNGLVLREDEKYNDNFEVDRIFTQDAKKGTWIKKGGFIGVSVSIGHDPSVELPLLNLMSMTEDDLDGWIAQNFMTNVSIAAEYSNNVELGRVISYEIGDKSVIDKVKRNTPIRITVSKGREDPQTVLVVVPDFTGETIVECTEFTNKNSVVLKVDKQYNDLIPEGEVIRQSVKAGDKIRQGDELTISISRGKSVLVPDYSSYPKQDATNVSQKLGITIVVTERYSSLSSGSLISQSIAANTAYNDGDVEKLLYSLGDQVSVGSFVSQDISAIDTWAKGVNGQGASITIKATYTLSNSPKDKILSQDKTNTSIDMVTTIKITVSLGRKVQVSNFVAPSGSGYEVAITMDEAMDMCNALNIVPIFVEAKRSGRLPGEVWYQSIAAGKRVSEGTTITLKYNPDNVIVTVPDFTGMMQADIIAAEYNKKLDINFVTADTYVDGYDNEVYQQSLQAGAKVSAGSAITLTISPGP